MSAPRLDGMEGTVQNGNWFRVRYEDGQYLGLGPTTFESRGYPSLIQVHECEAFCFDTPTVAAETAIKARLYPFTVEEAR